jgi:chitin synthase
VTCSRDGNGCDPATAHSSFHYGQPWLNRHSLWPFVSSQTMTLQTSLFPLPPVHIPPSPQAPPSAEPRPSPSQKEALPPYHLSTPQLSPPRAHRRKALPDRLQWLTAWRWFCRIVTFWAPNFLLSSLGGLKDKAVQQAWREKITLCVIIAIMCTLVGFVTVGFQKVLCPQTDGFRRQCLSSRWHLSRNPLSPRRNLQRNKRQVYHRCQFQYSIGRFRLRYNSSFSTRSIHVHRLSKSQLSHRKDPPCSTLTPCPLGPLNASSTYRNLNLVHTQFLAGYSWSQVAEMPNFIVLDGSVLNLSPYIKVHPNPIPGDNVDKAIRTMLDPSLSRQW